MSNKSSREKGFTLVELLAVIVILAIILVIAVPKIMSVIEDSKKATLESTVKMIASSAEKAKVQNTVLGKTDKITCDSVAKINKEDYASCSIEFEGDTAKVTIIGSGKFEGLNVCGGTKTSANAKKEECTLTCKSNEVYVVEKLRTDPYLYEAGDSDSCISYLKNNVVTLWPYLTEEEVTNMCTDEAKTTDFDELISMLVAYDRVTESDLIKNDIIKTTVIEKCVPTTTESCFDFDSETGTILEYYLNEDDDPYKPECPKDVVIPSKIDGTKVTILGVGMATKSPGTDDWFSGFTGIGLTSLIIQDGVEEIGVNAFFDNEIVNLKLPDSLKIVDDRAFALNNIQSIKLPQSITTINWSAFAENKIAGELDLSVYTKLTTIDKNAFDGNKITNLILPANIESIGDSAFRNNRLTSVKLAESITSIGSRAFYKSNTSNLNLTTIINPSGKSFDWYMITGQGSSSTCTFAAGTCGTVTIKASS